MEKYNLQNDLKVFGVQVNTFPNGVGDAFDKLMKILPQQDKRPYYGISQCLNGNINYIAAALETYDGEGNKYGYQNYTIERGEYLSAPLMDWTTKTGCIKDVFEEIIKDERVDNTKPAIEVYKNMQEMVCMVKIEPGKEMKIEFDNVTQKLMRLISPLDEEQLNAIPFEGSWTAGQVAEHLIKSNGGFAKLLFGPVKETERATDELVEPIKKSFLDFTIKMDSPASVLPTKSRYKKEDLLNSFEDIKTTIGRAIQTLDLSQTCIDFEIPETGFLTRTEAVWFVIYHTQRHIHQLENIIDKIKREYHYNL